MQTPITGAILDSESVTFRWDAVEEEGVDPNTKGYSLGVAASQKKLDDTVADDGYGDVYYVDLAPGVLETTAEPIPLTGDPIYVRLWHSTKFHRWHWEDYIYDTDSPPAAMAYEGVQTGESSASNIVATSTPLTGVTDDLYLAAISTKQFVGVDSVTGLGLSWTRVDSQCDGC